MTGARRGLVLRSLGGGRRLVQRPRPRNPAQWRDPDVVNGEHIWSERYSVVRGAQWNLRVRTGNR
jgi:hypothetical protein